MGRLDHKNIYPADVTVEDFIYRFDLDGKPYEMFLENAAVAFLMSAGVLTCTYVNDEDESQTALEVIDSDVFAWGYSGSLPISCDNPNGDAPGGEIFDLLKRYIEQPYGVIKWHCVKQNRAPQAPIVHDMIAAGAWDEEMEAVRPNGVDLKCCDWHRSVAERNRAMIEEKYGWKKEEQNEAEE